jgi:hypothetical protein
MNRAGSLIVIIGIVVAVSRIPEWLERKAASFVDNDALYKDVAAIVGREQGEPFSRQQRDELDSILKTHGPKYVASKVESTQGRLKVYEIYLVVGGTFLNGFGDYVVCLLKNCGP